MEELDLREVIRVVLKKKMQIILIVILFVVIGAVYTNYFVTPKYTSSTTLVLATDDENKSSDVDNAAITSTDVVLNSKLISTYSELVKSNTVVRQVISNLNLDKEEVELRKNIKVSSVKNTELLEISVTDVNPIYAANIANEIAKVFSEKVEELYKINNVHILDNAEVKSEPSNIHHTKDLVYFTLAGIVVAFGYVFIAMLLDNTVKSTDDFEREYGVSMIASIPLSNYDSKKKGGRK